MFKTLQAETQLEKSVHRKNHRSKIVQGFSSDVYLLMILRSVAQLAISSCGFRYVIQGLLCAGLRGFHSSEPQNFVGSAEPMEPTLTGPLTIFEHVLSVVLCIFRA